MFFCKTTYNRRGFLARTSAFLFFLLLGRKTARAAEAAAHLEVVGWVNSSTIRILIVYAPLGSTWKIQKSADMSTWADVTPVNSKIIGSGRIELDLPVAEPRAFFRPQLVSATMVVADRTYQFPARGQNLHTAMTGLANLAMESSEFPDLGRFVTKLNGTAKGGGKNWILFVNGEGAAVGSSSLIPRPGDRIVWELV